MIDYLIQNKEWIFGGIGVAVISWFFIRNSNKKNMSQKSGDHSTNIQVGRDFTSSSRDKSDGN